MPPSEDSRLASSFRDPSGFIFRRDGTLYRQVNHQYKEDYDLLMGSGLYDHLVGQGLLVAHQESAMAPLAPEIAYKVIQPTAIPFISYPYEWSFSMLKAAAIATLRIHQEALQRGMVLKDASAYNIQFVDAKPVLLDTLSFETYREGEPWIAYRQFCQHFLAPLALMAYRDVRLGQLLRVYLDGVPLDVASKLLPWSTRIRPGLLLHLHAHAKAQSRHADDAAAKQANIVKRRGMSLLAMRGLIDNLKGLVERLTWRPGGTEWGDYYDKTNYADVARDDKHEQVRAYLDQVQPKTVWDLGANTGVFSRIAADKGVYTVSCDIDPAAVEKNFLASVQHKQRNLLPLVIDLTNPSPSIGWHNCERDSLIARGPADALLALALIHHLAISNNLPLGMIAKSFSQMGRSLIIEFVPKSDSQVQRLLATRKDIFPEYTRQGFESAFSELFAIEGVHPVKDSDRVLYLMATK